jgi:Helix-turn-helix domain of resolvase
MSLPRFRAIGHHYSSSMRNDHWELPCTEKKPAQPPAFADTLVCALCGRKPRSRKGTSHDYYLAKRRRPLQRRPGPDRPAWKIDPSHWPEVVKRIEQGGSLRQVAREYRVSHETIRRVLVTVQGSGEKNRSRNRRAREKEVISVPRLGERRRKTGKK